MMTGGCHCGGVRYEVDGTALTQALCHCTDCRRHAGAPMVAWAMFSESSVTVTKGSAKVYASSAHGRRHFCPDCGTGLFYFNAEILPGIVDIQIATLDDPALLAPQKHVQVAERIAWMEQANDMPVFERYPPQK